MSFLPMVERELRAASRRRMTHWSRALAAMAAIGLFGLFYAGSMLARGRGSLNDALFVVLLVAGMFYSLFEAIRTGADCLSREKREGTLRLLFLTDLTGMDVVLGKLAAAALQSLYALIAMFPILVITIFMGGVTLGVAFREMLALLNLIFFAYALAIWCSARAYEAHRAVLSAFIWMGVLVAGTYFADATWGATNPLEAAFFGFLNPVFCGLMGFEMTYNSHPWWWFWLSFVLVHVEAWLMVDGAAFALRRNGEAVPARKPQVSKPRRGFLGFGRRSAASFEARRLYLDRNPLQWLVRSMERSTAAMLPWLCGVAAFFLFTLSVAWDKSKFQTGWMFYLTPLLYWIYLAFPARAGRLFTQMRETGSWELLGCTPLKPQEIASGIWRGLRPTLIRLLIAGAFINLGFSWERTIGAYVYGNSALGDGLWSLGLELVFTLLIFGLDMVALGWVGIWFALKSRGLVKAVLATLALVMIAPNAILAFCLSFLIAINGKMFAPNEMMFWNLFFFPAVMIVKDAVLIWWARDNFRLICRNMAELGHG